jgi:NAD(P)H-dependent flavin oxidoreductase YrpB (nitropropane dioxygenase family)
VDLDIIPKLQLPKIELPQIDWPRFDVSSIRSSTLPRLKIGDSVAKLPIIQGGMGVGISLSGLASAVANEGGIGVIAANSIGIIDPDDGSKPKDANMIALKKEIRKARRTLEKKWRRNRNRTRTARTAPNRAASRTFLKRERYWRTSMRS